MKTELVPCNFREEIEEYEYQDTEEVMFEGQHTGIFVRFKAHVSVLNDGFVITRIDEVDYDCFNRLPI